MLKPQDQEGWFVRYLPWFCQAVIQLMGSTNNTRCTGRSVEVGGSGVCQRLVLLDQFKQKAKTKLQVQNTRSEDFILVYKRNGEKLNKMNC